ncbi:MAG: uracil-DNA glycosylase [Kiritimatiellae bacterium]|nr:uracil-DNA glycosylase [Kiritimatiellia bacterium]
MAPVPSEVEGVDTLERIAEDVRACSASRHFPITQERPATHAVPGEGNGEAPDVMFVGEAPGGDEDLTGRPFVGRAGKLLTDMIRAMGYQREEVFIANICKCRPEGNRKPAQDEMTCCFGFLRRQIRLVRPKTIVALGATAVQGLLPGETTGITRLRGQWREFEGIPVMPTFHPSYLLRDPNQKKFAWSDLKAVLARLGRQPPQKA